MYNLGLGVDGRGRVAVARDADPAVVVVVFLVVFLVVVGRRVVAGRVVAGRRLVDERRELGRVSDLFRRLDANGDGKISYEEFLWWWSKGFSFEALAGRGASEVAV